MLSSGSTLSKHTSSSGPSEPLSRLACVRQCQETVQELASKSNEICQSLLPCTRHIAIFTNPQQIQGQNDKRARLESSLNDITTQFTSLRHLFVRLREIHEYVLSRENTPSSTISAELSRLLKQKSIYEEILQEKQIQLKIIIDAIRDITYQINTMMDLRHDGTINTLMNNANSQEK